MANYLLVLSGSPALYYVRSVRNARCLLLLVYWRTLGRFMVQMLRTLPGVGRVAILLTTAVLLMGVMGAGLFRGLYVSPLLLSLLSVWRGRLCCSFLFVQKVGSGRCFPPAG